MLISVCFGVLFGGLGLVWNALECILFWICLKRSDATLVEVLWVSGYVELVLTKMRNRSAAMPVDVL